MKPLGKQVLIGRAIPFTFSTALKRDLRRGKGSGVRKSTQSEKEGRRKGENNYHKNKK